MVKSLGSNLFIYGLIQLISNKNSLFIKIAKNGAIKSAAVTVIIDDRIFNNWIYINFFLLECQYKKIFFV